MKTLIVSLLLIASSAQADTLISYGVGIMHSAKYSPAEVKVFSLGYNEDLFGPLVRKYEIGLWADQISENRKSSGFASYSYGVKVEPSIFYIESDWGVGFITNRDSYLGGNFPQFFQDLFVGVKDFRDTKIGLNYKHISSASIYAPNRGRDLLTLRLQLPF